MESTLRALSVTNYLNKLRATRSSSNIPAVDFDCGTFDVIGVFPHWFTARELVRYYNV